MKLFSEAISSEHLVNRRGKAIISYLQGLSGIELELGSDLSGLEFYLVDQISSCGKGVDVESFLQEWDSIRRNVGLVIPNFVKETIFSFGFWLTNTLIRRMEASILGTDCHELLGIFTRTFDVIISQGIGIEDSVPTTTGLVIEGTWNLVIRLSRDENLSLSTSNEI
jgi:hypothetical protein